ncbi:cysteine hydrolase family protein [Aquamicrobium defluvii]|uniref:Isochorismatase n=1 Tax=Aquamicrobium defluvii TaxID=69279 RepID=A0A011VEA1_9HYPH|nr:isochorismatase family cysteine hydrolase [Aquamicrobium defluvii]EXL06770.1 isochorismatase [Aquamicrobium defluvii]EZQ15793.1 isochorismatase [Halopseudomonas bauzanensis]TDR35922.1 nicotinamidase-related amidase [Aquamicrobium defluvii]
MTQGSTLASYSGRDRKLDGRRTVVLIVDAQNAEISQEVRAQHPEFHEQVRTRALPNMRRLIDGARRHGAEIVYTVIESLTRDGRDRSLDHKLSNIHIPRGSPLASVIDEVAPAQDDIILPKTSSGVFNSTNIDYVLRNLGAENVVVAGFLTDQCVDMAIRDGADRGYYMVCATDACASYSQERHEGALRAFAGYCRLQQVDEVLADFESRD